MMMLKMFLLITALSAGSAARHYYLKSHYNWDEYIQVCSSALADLIRAICPGNYNVDPTTTKPRLSPRSSNERGGLSYDCCERMCTPRYILYYYCQNQERVNTGKDLEVWATLKPPTTIAPITTTISSNGSTTNTKYCYQQYIRGMLVLWECEKGDMISTTEISV